MSREHKILVLSLLTIAVVAAIFGCHDDPVKPVDPPRIKSFTATPVDIMPGDSSLLAYSVTGADSIKLLPVGIKLTPASSGQRWVKPLTPTKYSLLGYNKGGKDSAAVTVTMAGAVPVFQSFALSEDTILTGDSTVLSWKVVRCDSIKIDNGTAHVADADSGGVVVKPTSSRTYRAVAYNNIGADTSMAPIRIEIPFQINALNGLYYNGNMGSGISAPPLSLQVLDQQGQALRRPWIFFSVVEGDGTLSVDSAKPNSSGVISNDYVFGGMKGYGLIRAIVRGVDTLDLKARASVIRFGADGQGQFVKLYDNYDDIFGFNGQPASVDHPVPADPLYYVNYQTALGVVPIVLDVDEDGMLETADPVVEVILNTVFDKTTPEGIGVGSSIHAVRTAYGTPDVFFFDPTNPPAWGLQYNTLGALFYASTTPPDSAIIEVHLWDPTARGPAAAISQSGVWMRARSPKSGAATTK